MRARAPVLLLLLLLLAAPASSFLAPPALAQDTDEGLRLQVVRLRSHYGPEAWKDEAQSGAVLGNFPVPGQTPGATTYENPYADPRRPHSAPTGSANDWGYNLTVDVRLTDATGTPLESNAGYVLGAHIQTPKGMIPAKLQRVNATTFRATFDLDGETGKPYPALAPGAHAISLKAYATGANPAGERKLVATRDHALQFGRVLLDKPALEIPENALPTYSDITRGNTTSFYPKQLDPTGVIPLTVNFGIPHARATILLANNRASTPIFQGLTDANGRVTLGFEPGLALRGQTGGLILLEAHLDGDRDTVGNTVLAIPVSARRVDLVSIQYDPRTVGERSVDGLGSVLVSAQDTNATPESASRQGTLLLMKGNSVIRRYAFTPASFAPGTTERTVRIPATDIPDDYASYTLAAFFLDEGNRLYAFATANRGVGITLPPVTLNAFTRAQLPVTVRNFNDNHNGRDDTGLALTVKLEVTGLPGGKTSATEITVPEGREETLEIMIEDTGAVGQSTLHVTATAGELTLKQQLPLAVTRPANVFSKALNSVPAPGLPLLALALAGVALLATRRR